MKLALDFGLALMLGVAVVIISSVVWASCTDSPDRCVHGRTTLSNMPCGGGK